MDRQVEWFNIVSHTLISGCIVNKEDIEDKDAATLILESVIVFDRGCSNLYPLSSKGLQDNERSLNEFRVWRVSHNPVCDSSVYDVMSQSSRWSDISAGQRERKRDSAEPQDGPKWLWLRTRYWIERSTQCRIIIMYIYT